MKIEIESNVLKYVLRNVYFINGTAYAGKSTMVKHLAEKYNGICCGENYHDELMGAVDKESQPNLSYFQTMSGWQEFISRTPEQYAAWIDGCSREAADLELVKLIQLAEKGRKIFVDTNIPIDILKEISDYHHVAIMLSPQSMSVDKFFERGDEEKQFLLEQIKKADDPEKAMKNFRDCLARVNSEECYNTYLQSGFFAYIRNENSMFDEAVSRIEEHFMLK